MGGDICKVSCGIAQISPRYFLVAVPDDVDLPVFVLGNPREIVEETTGLYI